ncbi:MAG: type 1 glutamine amidotransferase domain-containing protein [Gemmatimonadaceae bacterium]
MAAEQLSGRKVAFLATDGVEEQELAQPWEAVCAAGGTPELISIKEGEIKSTVHDERGRNFKVDRLVTDTSASDYAALVLPGGVANPDKLRMNPDAVAFVRSFMDHDKPVAAICHGPWMLVEAEAVKGRTLTSYPSLHTDIQNAGGEWVDKPVSVDQKLVTSRNPGDLEVFCSALIATMSSAIDERSLDMMVEQTFPASDPLPGPSVPGIGT